jgi:preprotein translocase subunit YajC
MERKKILLGVLLLIVLIGGAFYFALWMKNRPTKAQREFAKTFSQKMMQTKIAITTGTVESVSAGKLVVNLGTKDTTVNVTSDTIISLIYREKKAATGKIADVKVGENVKVEYDKETMNATKIIVPKQ